MKHERAMTGGYSKSVTEPSAEVPADPIRLSVVYTQVEHLSNIIHRLEITVEDLNKRLAPVQTPRLGISTMPAEEGGAKRPDMSPLAEDISVLVARLAVLDHTISSIIGQLEV